jgi:hypothetical protein
MLLSQHLQLHCPALLLSHLLLQRLHLAAAQLQHHVVGWSLCEAQSLVGGCTLH